MNFVMIIILNDDKADPELNSKKELVFQFSLNIIINKDPSGLDMATVTESEQKWLFC